MSVGTLNFENKFIKILSSFNNAYCGVFSNLLFGGAAGDD